MSFLNKMRNQAPPSNEMTTKVLTSVVVLRTVTAYRVENSVWTLKLKIDIHIHMFCIMLCYLFFALFYFVFILWLFCVLVWFGLV